MPQTYLSHKIIIQRILTKDGPRKRYNVVFTTDPGGKNSLAHMESFDSFAALVNFLADLFGDKLLGD